MAHNCPQKQQCPQQQHQSQPWPGLSHNWQTEVEEQNKVVHMVCNDCTAEQWAQDWLTNIANEQNDVKELIM